MRIFGYLESYSIPKTGCLVRVRCPVDNVWNALFQGRYAGYVWGDLDRMLGSATGINQFQRRNIVFVSIKHGGMFRKVFELIYFSPQTGLRVRVG